MTQTTNLGLNIISDSAADKAMLFSEWRSKVAGTGSDSNMKIIDAAYGDMDDRLDAVEDEFGDLKSALHHYQTNGADVSAFEGVYTIGSDGKWSSNANARHVAIPIEGITTISIKANSSSKTYYAFLTDNAYASGASAALVPDTSRNEVAVGASAEVAVPSGAVYLYMHKKIGDNNYLPSKLLFDGIDFYKSTNALFGDVNTALAAKTSAKMMKAAEVSALTSLFDMPVGTSMLVYGSAIKSLESGFPLALSDTASYMVSVVEYTSTGRLLFNIETGNGRLRYRGVSNSTNTAITWYDISVQQPLSDSQVAALTSLLDVTPGAYFTASGSKIKAIDTTSPSELELSNNGSYIVNTYKYAENYVYVEIKKPSGGIIYYGGTAASHSSVINWHKVLDNIEPLTAAEVNDLSSLLDVYPGKYFTASGSKIKAIDTTSPSELDLSDNASYMVFAYRYGVSYVFFEIKSAASGLRYFGGTAASHASTITWHEVSYTNVITNQYENTYNITCSPTITQDTNQFLASTGDTTDRTGDIQALLSATGNTCRLGPGDFYVTGVEIPLGGMLIGSGYRTRIILADADQNGDPLTDGYAIKLNSYGCIKDMCIRGKASATGFSVSSTVGSRHGILYQGTAMDMHPTESQQRFRSMISNVWICYFNGGGITAINTGAATNGNMLVSDAHIYNCDAGINVARLSEFHQWTNISIAHCYYGVICNAGNNLFNNCNFSANNVGMLFDSSDGDKPNDAHGLVCNTKFAHNVDYALKMLDVYCYENFSAVSFGSGGIYIEDCNTEGATFNGCRITGTCDITIKNSKPVFFIGAMFRGVDQTVTIDSDSLVRFVNCYDCKTGNAVDPTAS